MPGVIVYGYMTAPIVEHRLWWLEHGSIGVRFLEAFYDDEAIIRAEAAADS